MDETMPSGWTCERSTCSGRNFPVRTSTVRSPQAWAPTMSLSRSSPIIHVIRASASSASSAASKYAGVGLPRIVASTCAANSRPATNAPESSIGPCFVCHQRLRCNAKRSAPISTSPNARAMFGYEKTRAFCSGSSPRPPMRTASTLKPTSCISPARSSARPGIVSASTRFPASSRAATAAVVCSSSSSSSIPRPRRSSASAARARVVEFVTNRSRWPFSRSRATASAAPRIGSPETCRTPSTSRRIAATAGESNRAAGRGG